MLIKAQVHLSTRVTEIISNTNIDSDHPFSIAVSTDTEDAPFLFDEIVITVPLGYLKRNLSVFSPPLPGRLRSAISHISYGRLEKVYINFPTAYWQRSSSTSMDIPFFTNFLHPTYAKAQNPEAWNIEFVSLAALPDGCAHPTLLFYMHGPCAAMATSLINGLDPDSPTYHSRLQYFFEPYVGHSEAFSLLTGTSHEP